MSKPNEQRQKARWRKFGADWPRNNSNRSQRAKCGNYKSVRRTKSVKPGLDRPLESLLGTTTTDTMIRQWLVDCLLR